MTDEIVAVVFEESAAGRSLADAERLATAAALLQQSGYRMLLLMPARGARVFL